MQTSSTAHPTYIDPPAFVAAMSAHWRHLGNTPSPNLRQLWHLMGCAYRDAICDALEGTDFRDKWRIVQPPTGCGKSQGGAVYAALLAIENSKINRDQFDPPEPTAVLIVVRQKIQAQELAETVNTVAARHGHTDPVANYHHSDHELTVAQRQASPVLVCTHAAYVNAIATPDGDRFSSFTTFRTPDSEHRRHLTVIDESIGNVVMTSQVVYSDLQDILRCIGLDDPISLAFSKEVATLHQISKLLKKYSADTTDHAEAFRDVEDLPAPEGLDFLGFRQALFKRDLSALLNGGKSDSHDFQRHRKRFNKALDSIKLAMTQYRYFAKRMMKQSFNTSSFLVPEGVVSPVCLDATASSNFLWELLEDRALMQPTVLNARSYRNVNLNIAWETAGLGKRSFLKDDKVAARRAARLVAELDRRVKPTESILIVCHKGMAPALIAQLEVHPNGSEFYALPNGAKVYVNWFNKIDGLNTYQHCEHVCIFGLPYLDETWALNMMFAIQGYNPRFLSSFEFKGIKDYRQYMEQRQMSLQVIQAINRVRCRRVVDQHGHCLKTNVWIILPAEHRSEGEFIRDSILQDMPGIQEREWNYKLNDPIDRLQKTKGGRTALPLALVQHMLGRPAGETTWNTIRNKLKPSPRQLKSLQSMVSQQFAAREGNVFEVLSASGIEYRAGGRGKPSVFYRL